MTLWADRDEDAGTVSVHVTHGPVSVAVKEDARHVRSFWGQLGRLLDEAEGKEDDGADG